MSVRKKLWLTFLGIVVLAGIAVFVSFPIQKEVTVGSITKEFKLMLGLDLQGGTSLIYQADTSEIDAQDQESAVEGVRDVIEQRVNAFGVSEPVVQTNFSGEEWRIIVELPGVEDINEAISMIGETPLLEFKEEEEQQEMTDEEKAEMAARNEEKKNQAEELLAQAQEDGVDFATLASENSEDPGSAASGGDLGFFARGIMVPEFEEAAFTGEVGKVYPELVESAFGYHIIKVEEKKEVDVEGSEEKQEEVRASHILIRTESEEEQLYAYPEYINTGLSGKQLERAQVVFDPNTGLPEISLEFNEEGKQLFAEITERNTGKTVAIYLDGAPISIPVVNEPIRDGRAVISGDFTIEEAKELTSRLNSGALPLPIELISQQNVGASLGEISIKKSLIAGAIGLALLALFMIFYYRIPGLVAVVALALYSVIILAIFKIFGVVLTLAGIAGFLLSIGMAVDANVLIFERFREEIRSGREFQSAIDIGFRRAWSSIRDSNISSLITCAILTWFGSSLIKGFALTLAIGILVSMFSAITVTRTLLKLLGNKYFKKFIKV